MAASDGAENGDGGTGTPSTRVDAAMLAVLVGGAAGWVAAARGEVAGLAVLGVVLGAALLLGGLVALPRWLA